MDDPPSRDPHRQRPAPGAAVLVLRGAPRGLQAHQARRAPEVLHGGRDPLLRAALRDDVRRGARAPSRRGARQPARRRRRDLPPRGAHAHLARQGHRRRVPRGAPRRARPGHAAPTATMLYGHIETFEHRVDHLLRLRALQDETEGLPGVHPARVPPRRQRHEEPAGAHRRRRAAHRRGLAPPARQRPPREGLLGQHDARGGADRACASAPTTSTGRSCTRRSTSAAGLAVAGRAHRGAARAAHPGGGARPGRARHVLQRRARAPARVASRGGVQGARPQGRTSTSRCCRDGAPPARRRGRLPQRAPALRGARPRAG